MKRMTMALNRMLVVQTLAFVASVFVLPANADYTLTGDETWSVEDVATKMTGVIDLKGHKLTVPQLTGNATITDAIRDCYQLLDSIESTNWTTTLKNGGPYILTGVQVSEDTCMELDFGLNANATYATGAVIFGLDKWNHGIFALAFESNSFYFYGSTKSDMVPPGDGKVQLVSVKTGSDYHMSIGSKSVNMTGSGVTSKGKNPYNITFYSGLNNKELALFGFNTGERNSSYIFKRLWITDSAGQAHTFVPVRQVSTGKLGILDLEAFNADPTSGFHGNEATSGVDFTPGEVTNTLRAATGELHVAVEEGTTTENTTVALSGSLKLVKEGAGAFVAAKTGQTYTGGTVVDAGTFQIAAGGETVAGSAVTVNTGATLGVNGSNGRGWTMQNGSTLDLSALTEPVSNVTFAADATINIALGARTVAVGDRVVSWTAEDRPDASVTFLTVGGTWESKDLNVRDDGLYLAELEVVQAVWTGANPSNVNDPANWQCTGVRGTSLEGRIPGGNTVVTLPNGCANSFPVGAAFSAREVVLPATIGGNLDWSGITAPFSGTLDLKGHTLTVPQLTGDVTITDSTVHVEYELLDSITSTGAQYIDTGVSGKPGLTASADVAILTMPLSDRVILGVTENGAKCWMMSCNANKKYVIAYGSGSDNFYTSDQLLFTVGTSYHLVASAASKNQTLKVDGTIWVDLTKRQKDTPTTENSIYVFANNNGGTAGSFVESLRLSKLTISDDTGVLRNFVPARRCSDGAVGLLDLANPGEDEFYANQGTGAFTAGTVTNLIYKAGETNPPGELHVNVAEGTTNENTTVVLSGSIKLVKEGAGTFVAQKTGQTYFGGTEVAEGLFELYNDSTGYTAAQQLLGCWGSTVTVATGGRLNLSGNKGLDAYSFVLNGGTLGNWHFKGTAYTIAEIGSLKLLADSYLGASQRISVMSGTVDLNEYTLFVETYRKAEFGAEFGVFTLAGSSTMTNGTFNVTTGGGGNFTCESDNDRDLRTVKLVLSCSTAMSSDIKAGDIELKYTGTLSGNGKILIYGTYTAGKCHRNCEMQNGSTLDLSGVTGVWSVQGTHKTNTDIAFASNATVKVSLGSRRLKSEQIVTWEGATAPDASVNFVLDPSVNARLIREPNGLRLKTGFMFRIR